MWRTRSIERTRTINSSAWIGFARKSSAPAMILSSRARFESNPDTTIMRMWRVRGSARNCWQTSMPDISGIIMSSSNRSGCCSRATRTASEPSLAVSTSCPSSASKPLSYSRIGASSSTTKILARIGARFIVVPRIILVPEVPDSGEDHRHITFIRRRNHLGVTDAATRLDHRGRPGFDCRDHTVGEREKGVAGNHAALKVKPGFSGFPDRNLRGIHATHLTRAHAQRSTPIGVEPRKNDGVGLYMLDHPPGEQDRVPLLVRRMPFGHDLHVRCRDQSRIALLGEQSARDGTERQARTGRTQVLDETQILFLPEDGESGGVKPRGPNT